MDRSYRPDERVKFFKFITARGEWDELRNIVRELGWDRNKVRQFNRVRAYWEGRDVAQKRQGARTSYFDDLINAYFKKVGIDPAIVAFGEDDLLPDAEERLTAPDWEDVINYGEGTLFTPDPEEDILTSPFAGVEIEEDGTITVVVGDSNPGEG